MLEREDTLRMAALDIAIRVCEPGSPPAHIIAAAAMFEGYLLPTPEALGVTGPPIDPDLRDTGEAQPRMLALPDQIADLFMGIRDGTGFKTEDLEFAAEWFRAREEERTFEGAE